MWAWRANAIAPAAADWGWPGLLQVQLQDHDASRVAAAAGMVDGSGDPVAGGRG